MNVGIVTCQKCKDLTVSEQALIPIFRAEGVKATPVVWNDPGIGWGKFDLLVIRSIWDYHLHPEKFLAWLTHLEKKKIKTLNPIPTLRRNYHKFYLRELEKQGVRIVPTAFIEKTERLDLSGVKNTGWQKAVIKPAISASAYRTQVFEWPAKEKIEKEFRAFARNQDLLVQQFIPEVQSAGELSLIFLNRVFSHGILKEPGKGEFRVQKEFGGKASAYEPSQAIIHTAAKIISLFDGNLLYARIDGIVRGGEFILMEAELIEPDLFLDYQGDAKDQFVKSTIVLAGEKG